MNNYKTLIKLFLVFFKVGSFTFGGGLAMLPLIENEVVNKEKWISREEILDIFAISQSVPGVIAINSSIFIGKKVGGLSGAIAATIGVILPAFISIILVILLLHGLRNSIYIEKVFGGIRAASAALILLSAIKLGKSSLKTKYSYIIASSSFILIILFNISAAWAVILGGIIGYLTFALTRRYV